MRGCLFTIALGALVIGALLVFALPRALEGVVAASLASGGLQAADTSVRIEQDDPLALATLRADRVTITATDATLGDLDVEDVDLTLEDVDLGTRTAAVVAGTLEGVLTETAGDTLRIPSIRLDGDSASVAAVASVDGPDVERLVIDRVEAVIGEPPTDVALEAPNVITITVRGFPVVGTLLVDETGALRMSLSGPVSADVPILEPGATPMALRAVRVAGDRLVLEGDVDLAGVLG